jgi:hypothetical protein
MNKRLILHFIAILLEFFGTLLIFLNAKLIEAKIPMDSGIAFVIGTPEGFDAWYYHCSEIGFALLFTGIILASCCLFLEHVQISKFSKLNNQ